MLDRLSTTEFLTTTLFLDWKTYCLIDARGFRDARITSSISGSCCLVCFILYLYLYMCIDFFFPPPSFFVIIIFFPFCVCVCVASTTTLRIACLAILPSSLLSSLSFSSLFATLENNFFTSEFPHPPIYINIFSFSDLFSFVFQVVLFCSMMIYWTFNWHFSTRNNVDHNDIVQPAKGTGHINRHSSYHFWFPIKLWKRNPV